MPDTAHKLYIDAIDSLVLLQTQSQPDVIPKYDHEFLLREMILFSERYVGKHLGTTMNDKQQAALNGVFNLLLANNFVQPQVVYMHRDYHSRNLMVLPQGNPGILDF